MQLRDAESVRKCVVYVGYRKPGGNPAIRGTGFLVGYNDASYLVTAKHNFIGAQRAGGDGVLVSFNKQTAGKGHFEADFSTWRLHPDPFTDVAVFPMRTELAEHFMDVTVYPASNYVSEDTIRNMPVTLGDEVFFPGLFHPYDSEDRNIPIVRAGTIAAMADERVKTRWVDGTHVFIDAYLVEARSLGGLSGSPVFVHFPTRRRLVSEGDALAVMKLVHKQTEHAILGLVHGHYDERVSIDGSRQSENVNWGIAMVVPFIKVIEVLKTC